MWCQTSLLILLTFLDLTLTDDLDGFQPGFRIDQIFIPPDCTYRAREGDFMYQHYTGTLEDGTKFDSSYDRGSTYNFHLGVGEVIRGMDMGMKGMCRGEKRLITIPPGLGYGNREIGSIPAGSTLIFEVELTDIQPSGFKTELLYMPEGCQRRSAFGDFIREHYNGTFLDGKPFDSSYDRNRTYDFMLGEKQVIIGVDIGLLNMCQGEMRRLVIPPILAYGSGGYGDIIPPDSTLVFDVELVEIVFGKLKWYKIDGPNCDDEDRVVSRDTISILYSGFTETGYNFSGGEEAYEFTIDSDIKVLHGLQQGVVGMCIGERRRLRVPPELAVGDVNDAGIPQQVRLTLDIELLDMQKEDVFKAIDADSDRYLTLKEVENWIRENPQFEEGEDDGEDRFEQWRDWYHTAKDLDSDGLVTRAEFYGETTQHDEL